MKMISAPLVVVTIALSSTVLLAPLKFPVHAAQSSESQTMKTDDSLQQQIVAHEREGLEALKTGDLDRFGNLTADEAVMVDAQGPASKAQLLKNVAGFKLTDYSMEGVKFVPLSANSGLISYKITEKGVSHGKEFTAQAYVSSIWIGRGGKWVCPFSQETGAR
jgi:hypothetical protein